MDSRYKERNKIHQEQEAKIKALKDKIVTIESGISLSDKSKLTLSQRHKEYIKSVN